MVESEAEDRKIYLVVMNHEEQYSLWPKGRNLPNGWTAAGKEGTKAECLSYIGEHWTDMRPLSLRQQMDRESLTNPSHTSSQVISGRTGNG
jgi:MbtH protein